MSDDREAARRFKPAADQGDAPAQYNLGIFYAYGRGGLAKNEREVAVWYRKAAEQGHARAQFNLGWNYANGCGVEKNEREAARLYKLAADQGLAVAQAAPTEKRGMFSRLIGRGADTRDGWLQQQEEEERQREAAARERQSRQQQQEEQERRRDAASGKMSAAQALEILGIKAEATEQDIRAAYNRLMKRVHPDVGGSEYFSKQLNDPRDLLLRQLRAGT